MCILPFYFTKYTHITHQAFHSINTYISARVNLFSSFLFSPSLKVTSLRTNPLIKENFTWTEEMVLDLRTFYDKGKTFIPTCYKVSIKNVKNIKS